MVVEVVLPGAEAEVAAGGDVWREVVDVEGFLRDEAVRRRWRGDRFPARGLMKPVLKESTASVEEGELREFLEDPRAVDGVGVGEQDQPVAVGGELADAIPTSVRSA